jgi:hypothetical protein
LVAAVVCGSSALWQYLAVMLLCGCGAFGCAALWLHCFVVELLCSWGGLRCLAVLCGCGALQFLGCLAVLSSALWLQSVLEGGPAAFPYFLCGDDNVVELYLDEWVAVEAHFPWVH